ncbi:MAG: hypothetical protein B1H11_02600 [Desulfobacteraceae bacterium 4484_190.1]|nr:MAG: hypothetical protein B1H11_02600 [Desulfobacteraceae bacterium 4484_190.1]
MSAVWGEITALEIFSLITGQTISGDPQTPFAGLSTDSRTIKRGELFWVLKGERFDGHDFVQKAVKAGAAGVVVQKRNFLQKPLVGNPVIITVDDTLKALGRFARWWRQQHDVRVLAITGSAGKTTTKEMAAGILELDKKTLKSPGNFNNLIGLPLTLFKIDRKDRNVVVEMGMNRPGEIERLTEIAGPDAGVITNAGMAHLEGFKDLEGVARAKVEMIRKISSDGRVALNGDDALLLKTSSDLGKEIITFGLNENNDIRACRIRNFQREGISFELMYQRDSRLVRLKVPGMYNVLNALAAAAGCICLNMPQEQIVEGLSRYKGLNGRFELIPLRGDILLVDDTYNANPSALKAALASIKTLVEDGGRIIVGLGEMMELGDITASAHREAGRRVAELGAEFFFAMGDHAHYMVSGALRAGMSPDHVRVVAGATDMIEEIKKKMVEKDLIFLKGSHKTGLKAVVDGLRNEDKLISPTMHHSFRPSLPDLKVQRLQE